STAFTNVGIAPAVQVSVTDGNGSVITGASNSIMLQITSASGTVNAALAGTATQSAVAGVATFNGLAIDRSGTGYTLTAIATGVATAGSSAFDIKGVPTKLALTTPPSASAQNR